MPQSNPHLHLIEQDPDHHLWRNGRLYWVAFTVHLPGWQKERVRCSLGTADLEEARRRRDHLLLQYPAQRACELSLRVLGRKVGGLGAEERSDGAPMGHAPNSLRRVPPNAQWRGETA